MVQKWAIGAMINVSGSIAINLGTNLMKLSHKMEKGETQQEPDKNNSGFRSAAQKPSAVMSSDDLEAAEAMISRPEQQHQQQQHHHHHQYFPSSSKGKNRTHGVEMTAYSAVAVAEEPEPRGLRAGSGKDPAKRGGGTRAAAAGAPAAAPAPPAAAAAAAREGKHPERWRRASTSSKGLGGADEEAGGGVGRSGYEEEETTGLTEESLTDSPTSSAAGVRRRSLSSPRPGMLANGAFGSGGGAGVGSSGGGDHFEWKTKVVWYLGAVVLVAGSLVNFASFGFAPQSLLASLGSVQFISNVVFGKVILREIVTRRIVIGTATIILGNTLTLCFSPHQDDNFSTHQLKAFYDLEYNTLLLLELLFALAMHAAYKSFKRSKEQGKPRRYSDLAMPLAYAMCSAIVGTQSVVNAKCLSELLTLTFQGQNQMGSPFTYLVIAIWFSTTVFWLVRMNRALAMFHGLFIIPALQVFWTFFSVIGGGFYFEEFHTLHVLGGLGFAVGVLVVFCGVYLLAPRTQTDHGRRSGAGGGDDEGVVSDGEESDLTRMLRLDDESPATSPRLPGGGLSPRDGMEAGDEEIDWDHTRMLSLGFFPSISTDQDVAKMGMGKLANNLEGIDGEGGHGDSQGQAGAGTSSARVEDASSAVRRSNMLTLSPPWSKPKDTPPRTNSPSGTGGGALSPFGQGGGAGARMGSRRVERRSGEDDGQSAAAAAAAWGKLQLLNRFLWTGGR